MKKTEAKEWKQRIETVQLREAKLERKWRKITKIIETKTSKLGGKRCGGGQWGSRGGTNEAVDLTKTSLWINEKLGWE